MCDIACCSVRAPNYRYTRGHWKFSLRPVFTKYHFTEPHALNKTLSLVPIRVGFENSRLVTVPNGEIVAELLFDRNQNEVRLMQEGTFKIHYDRSERAFTLENKFKHKARFVRRCSRVLSLEWGRQKFLIIPVHPCKKNFAICVVEQDGGRVNNRKVVEIERTSLKETYDVRFVDYAHEELVACIAWLILRVNRTH